MAWEYLYGFVVNHKFNTKIEIFQEVFIDMFRHNFYVYIKLLDSCVFYFTNLLDSCKIIVIKSPDS